MERKTKIVALWTLTLAGFLTHSLTDAMPAFWGREHCCNDTASICRDDFVYDAAHLHSARRGCSACDVRWSQMLDGQCCAGLHYGGFHSVSYVGTH